jgi:hypothetical protein
MTVKEFVTEYGVVLALVLVLLAIVLYNMYKPVEKLSELDAAKTNKKYTEYVFGGIPHHLKPLRR